MNRVYVGIGSNIDRQRWIRRGLDALARNFGILDLSPVYESEAVGFAGDSFYNLVVGFDTELPLAELVEILQRIEQDCERTRDSTARFSSRTMDLDILCYGNLCGRIAGLQLPRPEILQHDFVLRPLADLAPAEIHPHEGRTWAELWAERQTAADFVHSGLQRVEFNYRPPANGHHPPAAPAR